MREVANDVAGEVAGKMMAEVVTPAVIGIIAVVVLIYLIPTIIAFFRGHKKFVKIFLINLLLGWTAAGWIYALVLTLGNSRNHRNNNHPNSKKKRGKAKKRRG